MVKHGRIGAFKGSGTNLLTGTWVALGPLFTEHLVPVLRALPTLFRTKPPFLGEAYLAHRLLSGLGWPTDAELVSLGGF
eukprot:8371241-Heterocapsa_arctica.AAC.1